MTTVLTAVVMVWRGAEIPEDAVSVASSFGPMHGDEIFTEELAAAIARRDDRCLVVTIASGETGHDGGVGVALIDDRSPDTGLTIETAAPLDRPELHHALVEAVSSCALWPAAIRWRPPTTSPNVRFPAPSTSELERTIVEMHAELPLPGSGDPNPIDGVRFRDLARHAPNSSLRQSSIDAVIRINNAAFADHPEQGHMSPASFAIRTTAPWFDPHGLTIASIDGEDVGFVWMKCHQPRPAELYVVTVDPAASVKGLGRALVHAGFSHAMSEHGATHAMLFVDGANTRAMGLYESLGFRAVRRQDVVRIATRAA